jgi:hypothetical protein
MTGGVRNLQDGSDVRCLLEAMTSETRSLVTRGRCAAANGQLSWCTFRVNHSSSVEWLLAVWVVVVAGARASQQISGA